MQGRAVIIVAGGTGTRMNSPTPKQFLPLSGKPVLMHTFEAFHRFDPDMEFVLVLFKGLEDSWKGLIEKHGFTMSHTVVTGGRERFHSVKNGLDALSPDVKLVGIHDAVRPMVSQGTIARCFEAAAAHGAAIPAVHVVDTIRMVQGFASHTLPRKELRAVQTPQCFQKEIIAAAYQTEYQEFFTDDASVVELGNQPIKLVEGNRTNIKITTAEDMVVAEGFMKLG